MFTVMGVLFILFSFLLFLVGLILGLGDIVYLYDYSLVGLGGLDVGYEVSVDWISCLYVGTVLIISGCVILYSEEYMSGDLNGNRFLMLMVLFVMSSLLMVMGGGVISVSLGWDGLGLVSYCLVIYYQSSGSYKAGMITIMSNRVGDVALLVGIGWSASYGGWSYMFYGMECSGYMMVLGLLVVLAACTKSAQFPFSAWLPEAMAAPTPVSSLVHSSTLVTAGVFLLIRWGFLFEGGGLFGEVLMVSGLSTMLMGGVGASVEMDVKKLVAMSTLSQLGLMMYVISMGMCVGGYFHMSMHAYFKALMFMCVGFFIFMMGGVQDMRFVSGKFKVSFIVGGGLLVSVLCLGGFPFLCGFFSKDLLLDMFSMGEKEVFSGVMFLVGLGLSILYGIRLVSVMLVLVKGGLGVSGKGVLGKMEWGILILSIVSILSGVLFTWGLELGVDVVVLGVWEKIVGLLMLVIGLVGILLFFEGVFYMGLSGGYGVFGSSWYLGNLTGGVWGSFYESVGEAEESETMWMEDVGGKGVMQWVLFFLDKCEWGYGKSTWVHGGFMVVAVGFFGLYLMF